MNTSQCFKDLKVIELANVLAGPSVGMFFAELGAKVIKIENKTTGGDMTRKWKLPSEDKNASISAYYASVNWNKEVLFLNLKEEKDQLEVHKLVKEADIIISNYKFGKAAELKMDYDLLRQINPTLIYAHISGFGENSRRTAFDVVLQAETGFMSINGQPDSPPTKIPIALIDILAAHQLKEGILTALIQLLKTGKGRYVSVSLYDAAISSLSNQATNWLMAKHIPVKLGSIHPNIAPYGEIVTTKDSKKIVLAIGTDKQFNKLCEILNQKKLIKNKKFSTNKCRVKNREVLHKILLPTFNLYTADFLMKKLIENNVTTGLIHDIPTVLSSKNTSNLILNEVINNTITKRVKTAIFKFN